MAEWPASTVRDLQSSGVLLVEDGNHGEYQPRPDEFVESGVAFIRAADMEGGRVLFQTASKINDRARRRITKGVGAGGDALISHKGTVGKIASVPSDAPPFVPPIDVQRAIGRALGALDDKIELNRRMSETLEAIARALFRSWFVDFDPVRAKAESREARVPEQIASLFSASLEETASGPIPAGWRAGSVGDEFRLTMGQSPPGESYNTHGVGVPLFQGRTDFGFRFPTRRVYSTSPTRLAEPGDTLVSVRAPVGDVNVATEACAVGRGVAAIRHNSGSVSYTYYSMRAQREAFTRFEAEGTVFGSINKRDFASLPVVVPPAEVVAAFDSVASPIDARVALADSESRTLAALRDTLLPKLISGELRVGDAERLVESGS